MKGFTNYVVVRWGSIPRMQCKMAVTKVEQGCADGDVWGMGTIYGGVALRGTGMSWGYKFKDAGKSNWEHEDLRNKQNHFWYALNECKIQFPGVITRMLYLWEQQDLILHSLIQEYSFSEGLFEKPARFILNNPPNPSSVLFAPARAFFLQLLQDVDACRDRLETSKKDECKFAPGKYILLLQLWAANLIFTDWFRGCQHIDVPPAWCPLDI